MVDPTNVAVKENAVANADTLRLVIETHRDEMERHESMIGSVFNWTLTILLALGAGFVGLATADAWTTLGSWSLRQAIVRLSVAGFCPLIAALAIAEMMERKSAYNKNARIVARASELLGLFEENHFRTVHDPLYPREWRRWGEAARPAHKFLPLFHTVVLLCPGRWHISDSVVYLGPCRPSRFGMKALRSMPTSHLKSRFIATQHSRSFEQRISLPGC